MCVGNTVCVMMSYTLGSYILIPIGTSYPHISDANDYYLNMTGNVKLYQTQIILIHL